MISGNFLSFLDDIELSSAYTFLVLAECKAMTFVQRQKMIIHMFIMFRV